VVTLVHATLSIREACLLGLVQGLTEFLPVSSDGHLALLQHFLTPMPPEQKLAIDVALHLGTLLALVLYFRRELGQMAWALVRPRAGGYLRAWSGLIVLGTVPVAVVGLTMKARVEESMESLPAIGVFFLTTGTLLYLAGAVRGANRTESSLGTGDALVVGCFQVFALLPGISRSGTTIAAGLFRRVRSDVAAKFSFLLGIPAVAGAVVVEARPVLALGPELHAPLAAGVSVAAVAGVAAIAVLMRVVRSGRLGYFAYYCWALGGLVLLGSLAQGGE
jgi:undecaprenyl-diphosphatase